MLKIAKAVFKQLVEACKEEFPREACGLIAGVKGNEDSFAIKIYPLRNIAKSSFTYETDAEEVYNAFINIEETGLSILGVYHSHPFSQAEPSELDRRNAFYPGMIHVIVSLIGDVADVKAYLWSGEEFTEYPISIEEEQAKLVQSFI
ncbi:M67 family metallopeptidase [Candidatus Bathyarchaeota archaeon]|nr:M67 family metallopeptidase [Candidatus Bathyarchaeota archaeon]MBS7613404.1 M67 family metallopeptidase [Candidatus Bathyarchaeota archaeon]MBS7618227.1 M67 family metallopeptidase [Candidatus Bathyarchaeota archaeon]